MKDVTVDVVGSEIGTIVELPVSALGISIEHLVRPIVDEDVEMLKGTNEQEWDPIEVRKWPDEWEKPTPLIEYHVISGNHRTRAARKKGLQTLRCKIVDAPDDLSYTIAAIQSNSRHGKPFTQEQRLALARKLSEQGQSLPAIAKVFSVHKATISNWLTGRDTNAARKETPIKAEPARDATAEINSSEGGRALLSWIVDAPVQLSRSQVEAGLASLPPGIQEKAKTMQQWIAEVLG